MIIVAALLFPTGASAQERTRPTDPVVTVNTARLREPFALFALGDSFISGEGDNSNNYDPATDPATDPTGQGNACHRSYNAHPEVYATSTSLIQSLDFVACSGATVNEVRVTGQYGEPAQLDVFGAAANTTAPRLVLLSVGGNDAGFVPTLSACATTVDCHLDPAITTIVDNAIANLQPSLEQLYTEIVTDPANANNFTALVVIGYPKLFGNGTCPTTPLDLNALYTPDERAWMDSKAFALNRVIKRAVDSVASQGHRVHLINPVWTFWGREACGTSPLPKFINPLDLTEFEHSFHPNEAGHAALAARVENFVRDRVIRFV